MQGLPPCILNRWWSQIFLENINIWFLTLNDIYRSLSPVWTPENLLQLSAPRVIKMETSIAINQGARDRTQIMATDCSSQQQRTSVGIKPWKRQSTRLPNSCLATELQMPSKSAMSLSFSVTCADRSLSRTRVAALLSREDFKRTKN